MEQEFQEDEDQEEQSQQAESGSNLNDASMNQDDDPNIHNQLTEISKDKRQIKRICLIRIRKDWKSERQIFMAFLVMSFIALVVFCGIILANMNIATYLIEQSAQKETEVTIQNTLNNSVQVCSNLYKELFFRYSVSLKIISRLFLSSINLDDSFYDYPAYSTFPLKGNKKYVSIKEDVTDLTNEDISLQKYYNGQKVSLNYITYFSFKNKNDFTQLSTLAQEYLDGADNLNYFLKNLVYFKKTLARIQQLYLSLGDELQVFYPAGSCKQLLKYQGTDMHASNRPWYQKAMNDYQGTQKVNYVLSGPYNDLTTGLPCLTLSQVILTKTNTVIGVIGLDILTSDINDIIPIPQLYTNGKLYLANLLDGVVLNDPCNVRVDDPYNSDILSYNVDSTTITNFTTQNWSLIQNQNYENGTFFEVINGNNDRIIIHRMFIGITDPNKPELVMFAAIPHDEGYIEYGNIQNILNTDFRLKQAQVIIVAGSITLFSLICSFYFVKTIVSPLQQLADCTKEFTNQEKKNSSDMKKKTTFDDIKTSDSDIESLIMSFKKLIKDLSGFKKGTRRDNQTVSGEEYIEYPRGDRQLVGFNKQTKFLLNYEDFQEKMRYHIDSLEQFSFILQQQKENGIQDIDYFDLSQNDSSNQDYVYQKIEVSFLHFIDIQLNNIEQSINDIIRKGQIPSLGEQEIQIFELIKAFIHFLALCQRNIILYDKFRSSVNQEQQDDDQDHDPIQEEEYSNLPEEALCMYDRKTSIKRIEELLLKFNKIAEISIEVFKKNIEKKNTYFINKILPKEIID